jgi:hypothetical protein
LLAVAIAAAQDRESVTRAAGPAAVEVFNPVEGRTTVTSSRPEGAKVEKGEIVCELDPGALQDRLTSQEIVVRGALADVQASRLAREAAVMALTEYKEGRFIVEMAETERTIKRAESRLAQAEDRLDWARRMFEKGYVSMAEKVAEELALKESRFALEQAQSQRKLLVDYTKNRTIKELTGQMEAARARELEKQAALEREQATNRRLGDQVRRCKVAAPVSGRIHYPAPMGTGAVVHDGQVLFRIVPEG